LIIKIEPAGFFMHTVILIANLEDPDPEDQDIKEYLDANELEPKYRSEGDFEGRNSESMQFGGCYLGKHTGEISLIQQRYVEAEIVAYEINRHLGESDQPVEIPDDRREGAVAELLKTFNNVCNPPRFFNDNRIFFIYITSSFEINNVRTAFYF